MLFLNINTCQRKIHKHNFTACWMDVKHLLQWYFLHRLSSGRRKHTFVKKTAIRFFIISTESSARTDLCEGSSRCSWEHSIPPATCLRQLLHPSSRQCICRSTTASLYREHILALQLLKNPIKNLLKILQYKRDFVKKIAWKPNFWED